MELSHKIASGIRNRISFLRRSESGTLSVEAVLVLPMLLFAYLGMYVFFEGLRERNINLKAAYTVGDLLSRETNLIDMDYLNGMNGVFGWLTRTGNEVAMRVTVVRYDEEDDKHVMVWSRGVSGKPDLEQGDIEVIVTPHVPILADADSAIVVETWATYQPLFNAGLETTELYNIIVTPPRFTDQLMLVGIGDGGGSEHNDGSGDGLGL